jgi:serine/threonine protein kinase
MKRGKPGDLVDGRYRLEAQLGAGGFGEVWRATHIVDGSEVRTVAIKLVDAPGAGGGTGWLDEVRAVRDVACDAVPTIYDAGVAPGGKVAFIAMELLAGEPLDARLGRGPIPWRRALAIAREVARALAAVHRVGVVHCDLKPQNVFLCASGRVCVLDFGVAALGPKARGGAAAPAKGEARGGDTRPLGPKPLELAATDAVPEAMMPTTPADASAAKVIVGTPGYLPPEAYSGEGRTPAADAYALGVLLHRMITGRLPQRMPEDLDVAGAGTPSIETILRARSALSTATILGDLVPVAAQAPGTPAAIAAVIAKLTALPPADRPADVLEQVLAEAHARPYGVPDPPYVGLEAFDSARAGFLAGRAADIAQIAQRLEERRAVVLAGPSGSGKSSLAVAGVAARLDERLLLGTDGWRVRVVRSNEPIPAIETGDGLGTVVVFDQLEEVLRLPDAERDRACAAFAALCSGDPGEPVRVIATVRDDLFGRLAAIPALGRIPEQNLYVVRGVEPNAVPEIVVGPARAAGYRLDDEAAVVGEAAELLAGDPGALPLVQFALTRWWERRDREARVLPREAWREIGGIAGALGDAAEELHDRLGAFERAAMRRVLVTLFRPDGTRERLPERELVGDATDRKVVALLVARRLLRRSSGATLEVVHEALGARWPLLRSWLDETRAERELIHDARLDAERWRRAGRPPDLLWRGARLAAAGGLRDQLGDAAELIDASLRAAGGQRRLRLAAFAVLVGLIAVAVALVVAWVGSDAARERAVAAQRAADAARAEAEREAATNRELRAAAEEDRRAAEIARAEAERAASKMRAAAAATLQTASDQKVAAEEQRRKAEVAELRRQLAEAAALRP